MSEVSEGCLLDSSAVIRHFRGRLNLFQVLAESGAWYIPVTVLGELLKGALRATQPEREQRKIQDLLELAILNSPTAATAAWYARIVLRLERDGLMIPQNDIWIAASAMELGLPLITCDAHFQRVEGLRVRQLP